MKCFSLFVPRTKFSSSFPLKEGTFNRKPNHQSSPSSTENNSISKLGFCSPNPNFFFTNSSSNRKMVGIVRRRIGSGALFSSVRMTNIFSNFLIFFVVIYRTILVLMILVSILVSRPSASIWPKKCSSSSKEMMVRDPLNSVLDEEMSTDPKVFMMGEEVGEYQGAYKITKELLQKYGPERVRDTPITEAGFTRIGVGATYYVLRPVVEFMTFNFAI